jgi:hypothetical protein
MSGAIIHTVFVMYDADLSCLGCCMLCWQGRVKPPKQVQLLYNALAALENQVKCDAPCT